MSVEIQALIDAAREARSHAYAPYSKFLVGAALRTVGGQVFTGCNVENAAYGLCNCAERTAFFTAIAAGCRPGNFSHVAVIADSDEPVAPCGACRQVMMELGGPMLHVIQANLRGEVRQTTMGELLPDAFRL